MFTFLMFSVLHKQAQMISKYVLLGKSLNDNKICVTGLNVAIMSLLTFNLNFDIFEAYKSRVCGALMQICRGRHSKCNSRTTISQVPRYLQLNLCNL